MRRSFVVSLALLAACGGKTPQAPEITDDVTLRRLAGCDDLRATLTTAVIEAAVGGGYYRGGDVLLPGMAENTAADGSASAPSNTGAEAPSSYTGTNNQEAGVDELDAVKTNGTHIFVAQNRAFHVLDSFPAEATSQIAKLDLPGWVSGMFLVDDATAVVVTNVSDYELGLANPVGMSLVRSYVIDVSDPAAPAVTRTEDAEGWLVNARMVDGRIHLVLQQSFDLPYSVWDAIYTAQASVPWTDAAYTEEGYAAWQQQVREAVAPVVEAEMAALDLDAVLPGARTDAADFAPMAACEDLYVPAQVSQLGMLTVATLDVGTPGLPSAGLLANGWTVYASQNNLFISQTSGWWWGWDTEPGRTHIHQFAIDGDEPAYLGSGAVEGWVYGSYAFSERDGNLRVATTDMPAWGGGGVAVDAAVPPDASTSSGGGTASSGSAEPSTGGAETAPTQEVVDETSSEPATPASNVFVLDLADEDGVLDLIGEVRGIAPGESIQAVRYVGDVAYVVTFRQTDPLFTIDLADPAAPAVVGELVMTGYSAYLHPISETHLLGVGMNGLETGQLTGLSLAVFDVSDKANPTLVHRLDVTDQGDGWAWSDALWDPHAFTWANGTLSIPATTNAWDPVTGLWSGFSGAIVFHADVDGISELGRIDHAPIVAASDCLYDLWWGPTVGIVEDKPTDAVATDPSTGAPDGGASTPGSTGDATDPGAPSTTGSACDYTPMWTSVRRSVFIDDAVYTVSDHGVAVNDLADPATGLAEVVFYPKP